MKFSHIQQSFFFGLLLITTGVFLWMLGTYLFPVLWAIVIALVFYPVYEKLVVLVRHHTSIASLLTIIGVVLLVVIPLMFIGGLLVKESVSLYQGLVASEADLSGTSLLVRATEFTAYLEPYGISQAVVEERLRNGAATFSQVLAGSLVTFSQLTFSFIVQTAIMLYLLFFFLRDGMRLQKLLIHYLPLGDAYEKRLLVRFSETVRAVMKGTVAIALLQGIIGGTTFWLVGVANPVLWGVAMAVMAVIPVLGTAIIWLPAAVILIATGSLWSGVAILVVGGLIISTVDEFLRPILVGRGSKMPDAMVLLATIGGLATFGVSGFIVGPIIAAFFLSLWIIFEERYRSELAENK
jgi:predicted PurR-regulated permease PerM